MSLEGCLHLHRKEWGCGLGFDGKRVCPQVGGAWPGGGNDFLCHQSQLHQRELPSYPALSPTHLMSAAGGSDLLCSRDDSGSSSLCVSPEMDMVNRWWFSWFSLPKHSFQFSAHTGCSSHMWCRYKWNECRKEERSRRTGNSEHTPQEFQSHDRTLRKCHTPLECHMPSRGVTPSWKSLVLQQKHRLQGRGRNFTASGQPGT